MFHFENVVKCNRMGNFVKMWCCDMNSMIFFLNVSKLNHDLRECLV